MISLPPGLSWRNSSGGAYWAAQVMMISGPEAGPDQASVARQVRGLGRQALVQFGQQAAQLRRQGQIGQGLLDIAAFLADPFGKSCQDHQGQRIGSERLHQLWPDHGPIDARGCGGGKNCLPDRTAPARTR